MPSGNAIYTYTGKEPSVTIQGHEFVKDQPSLVRDNGVIAVLEGRKDFESLTASQFGLMNPTAPHKRIVIEAPAKPKGKAK